jgi:hypothetical protein
LNLAIQLVSLHNLGSSRKAWSAVELSRQCLATWDVFDMRKYSAVVGLALVTWLMCGPSVQASIQQFDHVKLLNGIGSPGGIFYVDNVTDAVEPNFPTFCVEILEHITLGTEYEVVSLSNVTIDTNKTLGDFTAWIYTNFINLVNGGSFYDNAVTLADLSVEKKVNSLQKGIWEGMLWSATDINNVLGSNYDTGLLSTLHSKFTASGWTGTGDVYVMNLKTLAGGKAQDQLAIVPPGSDNGNSPVPEPMSLFVWSLLAGCVGVAIGRRRD